MPKYGTFKYGEGLYGAQTETNLLWSFLVAWDGNFTGDNEASRMVDLYSFRGRRNVLSPNSTGLVHYEPGKVQATLDNSDGRYSSWNTLSPLYPNVTPGKFARILVQDGSAGTNYSIMRGIVTDIQPYRRNGQNYVQITVEDGLRWLANQSIKLGMTTGTQLDNLSRLILDEADWPSTEWSQPGNTTTKGLNWYWAWNENALQAQNELADLGLGVFYHDRNGMARFAGANEGHTTATIAVDESELLRDITITQPWEVVRNEITVVNHPKKQYANTEVLWEIPSDEMMPIPASATVVFEAKLRNETNATQTSAINLTTAHFDFTLSATDPYIGLVYGYDLIVEKYATSVLFKFANRDGGIGYLWGTIIPDFDVYDIDQVSYLVNDVTSQATYGQKSLVLDTFFMQNTTYAQECGAFLLAKYKDPKPYPVIKAENRTALQFTPDIYRYTFDLTLPTFGIDDLFRVGGIEHRWLNENGQAVQTTFWLEPKADLFSFTP